MDMQSGSAEPVTISDLLELASWDRPRSLTELRSFVDGRMTALDGIDDADFE